MFGILNMSLCGWQRKIGFLGKTVEQFIILAIHSEFISNPINGFFVAASKIRSKMNLYEKIVRKIRELFRDFPCPKNPLKIHSLVTKTFSSLENLRIFQLFWETCQFQYFIYFIIQKLFLQLNKLKSDNVFLPLLSNKYLKFYKTFNLVLGFRSPYL